MTKEFPRVSSRVAGIIPARGGSKGIPRKNIALLAGKPLIAWTIQAVQSSSGIDRVVVSTDDEEIADVARHYGADVPFLRPSELAQDETSGMAPILHAVEWLQKNEGYAPEMIMCLQPTSPLRSPEDIDAAIEIAAERKADAVISVMPVEHPPDWMRSVDSDGRLKHLAMGNDSITRRQDAPPVYALNGAIYLARRTVLLEQETWYTDQTYAYIMPPERSLDIDTEWDLRVAGLILKDKVNHAGA
jgi:N-acylneuraminate cytidylyltransferase/CMP-N,N'-diacetyllegionaminic acid synthase